MPADMRALTADLAAETAALEAILDGLEEAAWELPTPAHGWAIRDQISHLAYFDEAATLAATDPQRFAREAAALSGRGADFAGLVAREYRDMPPAGLRSWFGRARAEYLRVFAALDPAARLPWYGPAMSAASSVTARLMETWAHGQDVADAAGIAREPTARLRHVAHLGVATRGFSFRLRGKPVPDVPVRVELAAPDGSVWTWGPAEAADRVEGDALDFCLLVTQRRNRADLRLAATGPVADAWLELAQAFAGPPGPGRAPRAAERRNDDGPPGPGSAAQRGGEEER
jgi:uncharacterized protein (TIGR03084 family)